MTTLYIIGYLFSILVAFIFVVWLTLKPDNKYDLNQESEDLINNKYE